MLAGVPGFEPGLSVLETDVLTVDTIPLRQTGRGDLEKGRQGEKDSFAASPRLRISVSCSLCFLMTSVLAAPTTELLELETFSRGLFVLCGRVVAAFAITTLEHNIIARHNVPLKKCS